MGKCGNQSNGMRGLLGDYTSLFSRLKKRFPNYVYAEPTEDKGIVKHMIIVTREQAEKAGIHDGDVWRVGDHKAKIFISDHIEEW